MSEIKVTPELLAGLADLSTRIIVNSFDRDDFIGDFGEIDATFIAAACNAVPALVAEVRVLGKALEIAAAPVLLFCHNVDGRPRCPLYTFTPPRECGPDIQLNSDECKRLRVEHAIRKARAALGR
jgi:hypothetical protein